MPPGPILRKPPKPPDTPLPRAKAPGWFELAAQTLGGALGIPPLSAEDYDSPEGGRSIDRAGTLGELLSLGGVGTMLGMAVKGGKAVKGSLGAAAKRIPNPIKAYHGSPHDFDQFSMSKIGTGEGAQAYGHGLYFAEAEGVADEYRKTLSHRDHAGYANAHLNAQKVVDRFGGDAEHAVEVLKENIGQADPKDPNLRRLKDTLEMITSGGYKNPLDRQGRTYEVNIHATPDELLDWDKPLSQQPAKVREAMRREYPDRYAEMEAASQLETKIKALSDQYGKPGDSYKAAIERAPEAVQREWKGLVVEYNSQRTLSPGRSLPTNGEQIYRQLHELPDDSSHKLKQYGIKGIQYLDQGSRNLADIKPPKPVEMLDGSPGWEVGSSTGTRRFTDQEEAAAFYRSQQRQATKNFVIFDDELIEIARKYGIPLATAAALVKEQGGTVQHR